MREQMRSSEVVGKLPSFVETTLWEFEQRIDQRMHDHFEKLDEWMKARAEEPSLRAAVAEQQELRRALDALEKRVADAESSRAQSKDESVVEMNSELFSNAYSMAIHELLWPTSVSAIVQCTMLVLFTVVTQYILALAFLDAAWLFCFLGQLPMFFDPIETATFYPPSGRAGVGGDQVQLNVVCVVASCLLLGLLMRTDNLTTMVTANPIDCVIDQDWRLCLKHQPLLLVWRVTVALFLWLCWCVRALCVPTMAGIGTGLILASGSNADEIVLNSVAIAFVFDLDDIFYKAATARVRAAYEASPNLPSPLPPPSSTKQSPTSTANWLPAVPVSKWAHSNRPAIDEDDYSILFFSWVIYANDVWCMFTAYAIPAGIHFGGFPFSMGLPYCSVDSLVYCSAANPSNDLGFVYVYNLMMWWLLVRSSVLSLSYVLIVIKHHLRSTEQPTTMRRVLLGFRLAICVGSNTLGAWLMFRVYYFEYFYPFGARGWKLRTASGTELMDCLMQVRRNASCVADASLESTGGEGTYLDLLTNSTYGVWQTHVNTPGWSSDSSSPNFYDIDGIGG